MTKIQDILNEMVDIINRQSDKTSYFDANVYQFTYNGNIKSKDDIDKLNNNPSIVIYGEDIKKFNDLYESLYKALKVDKKQVSIEQFKKDTRNLFFYQPLESELKKIIEVRYKEAEDFYYIAPIYGIVCENDILDFGKIFFVSSNHIYEFAKNITNIKNDDWLFHNFNNTDKKEHLLYFVRKYKCYDANFTKERFFIDLDEIINVLRFLSIIKTDRSYIDRVQNNSKYFNYSAISKTKANSNSTVINLNDIPIIMNKAWFNYEYSNKIMNIICKDNKNDLEQRIVRSLIWCGRSLEEYYLDIACAEVTFAFESIFKSDKNRLITQSVQDQIAESAALILNNNYNEIIKQIKDLKEFYSLRSAIVHGGKQDGNLSIYNKNLNVFRNIVVKLLEDETYSKCVALEDLKDVLDKKKYS